MTNVKVFADKQTDGWTNRWAKNYMPTIYPCGAIKTFKMSPVNYLNMVG